MRAHQHEDLAEAHVEPDRELREVELPQLGLVGLHVRRGHAAAPARLEPALAAQHAPLEQRHRRVHDQLPDLRLELVHALPRAQRPAERRAAQRAVAQPAPRDLRQLHRAVDAGGGRGGQRRDGRQQRRAVLVPARQEDAEGQPQHLGEVARAQREVERRARLELPRVVVVIVVRVVVVVG